jgi:hypothetical protein
VEVAVGWELLGGRAPETLREARQQAHWGAQVISAAGETFLPHQPDTSHTAMTWDARHGALTGQPLGGPTPLCVGLRVADLGLLLLEAGGAIRDALPLPGRTWSEAVRWTSDAVKRETRGALDAALLHPGYELPPHPIAQGKPFAADPGLGELALWYANGAEALARVCRETPGATAVLCWPHHFDIALQIELAKDGAGVAAGTVGVGLSPGDASIEEPYWYVNHDPSMEGAKLPPLATGEWFTQDWFGAALRGSALVAAGDARAQEARLRAFLGSAIAASRALALAAASPD